MRSAILAALLALARGDCYNSYWGSMPNYKQCDRRWKCYPYAGAQQLSSCSTTKCDLAGGPPEQTNNICGSGCGITSSAMVLSFHGRLLDPPQVADFLLASGFRNDLSNLTGATCNGVSHIAICAAGAHWGLGCQESSSFEDLDRWLRSGPVIAHVRSRSTGGCKFTQAGHYIVVTARSGSSYNISDPNSCEEQNTHASRSELSSECELVGFVRIGSDLLVL
ncbi:unnamed protein product [Effrenium voratum]|nr:unnamed protein product [Effrenium voratum]